MDPSGNSATTRTARRGASSVAGTSGSTVGRRNGTSVGGASGPFAETVDTPFYRLHKPAELAVLVLTLLSHGCPTQAIVAAFGLDERTVARWLAGPGCTASGCMSTWWSRGSSTFSTCRRMSCGSSRSARRSGWPWRWQCRRGCG